MSANRYACSVALGVICAGSAGAYPRIDITSSAIHPLRSGTSDGGRTAAKESLWHRALQMDVKAVSVGIQKWLSIHSIKQSSNA